MPPRIGREGAPGAMLARVSPRRQHTDRDGTSTATQDCLFWLFTKFYLYDKLQCIDHTCLFREDKMRFSVHLLASLVALSFCFGASAQQTDETAPTSYSVPLTDIDNSTDTQDGSVTTLSVRDYMEFVLNEPYCQYGTGPCGGWNATLQRYCSRSERVCHQPGRTTCRWARSCN